MWLSESDDIWIGFGIFYCLIVQTETESRDFLDCRYDVGVERGITMKILKRRQKLGRMLTIFNFQVIYVNFQHLVCGALYLLLIDGEVLFWISDIGNTDSVSWDCIGILMNGGCWYETFSDFFVTMAFVLIYGLGYIPLPIIFYLQHDVIFCNDVSSVHLSVEKYSIELIELMFMCLYLYDPMIDFEMVY